MPIVQKFKIEMCDKNHIIRFLIRTAFHFLKKIISIKISTLRNHNQIKILALTLVVYEMAIKKPNNSSMEIDFIDFDIIARFFGIKQNSVL